MRTHFVDGCSIFACDCVFDVFSTNLKAVLLLHETCVVACLAIVLRHKLQAKLQGEKCLAIKKSGNIFVAKSIAMHCLAIALCSIPLATCLAVFYLSSHQKLAVYKLIPASTEIARQAAWCNRILTYLSLI